MFGYTLVVGVAILGSSEESVEAQVLEETRGFGETGSGSGDGWAVGLRELVLATPRS